MKLKEISDLLGDSIDCYDEIKEIKTDSRNIEPGDLFIALRGNNYDGNDYIKEAFNKGALACVTNTPINDKCIYIKNTYDALFLIGNYIRNKYDIPLIAITGSNGKTTTKDLISHILNFRYNVLKNIGSKNNIIGVSDTLFKLNDTHEIIIMELGTNHLGEISKLSKMCNPNVGVITNIGTSHIGNFINKKNIFREKYSITDGMYYEKLIVNGDDRYLKKIKGYKCGIKKNNDLIAYNIKEGLYNVCFNIFIDKEYLVVFNNPGMHFVNDILLAIKVCLNYGMNINDIINQISTFKLPENRMNIEKVDSNVIISDFYNSSYESIISGINYLKNIKQNKILIIGDILELGNKSKSIHKSINRKIKKLKSKVITVGIYSKYIKGNHFSDTEKLIKYLESIEISNSYIYIKGSHKMHLENVYEYLKKIFKLK